MKITTNFEAIILSVVTTKKNLLIDSTLIISSDGILGIIGYFLIFFYTKRNAPENLNLEYS